MNKRKVIISIMVMCTFIFLLTGCFGPDPVNKNNNNIQGQVKVNGNTVADVQVSLEGEGISKNTTTDSSGLYSFNELPDGSYTLTFNKSDQINNETRNVTVSGGETVTKNLILETEDKNNNTIQGQVKIDGSSVADVDVALEGEGITKSTSTDSNGEYSFTELPDGNYTLTFNKGFDIDNETLSVEVSDGVTVTKDLILDIITMDEAKQFVKDLKQNGINIRDAGEEQATKIENNFKQEVIPYTVGIGYRMKDVGEVVRAWSVLMMYGPGEYEVNLNKWEDYESLLYDGYDEKNAAEESGYVVSTNPASEDLTTLDIWEWDITFANIEDEVAIRITNPYDIYFEEDVSDQYPDYDNYEKITIDYSDFDFEYMHTSSSDSTMEWSLDCAFNATETETIEFSDTNTDGDWNSKRDYTVTLPREGTATLDGVMTDDRNYTDEDNVFADIYEDSNDYPEIPPIGTIEISDTSLTLDFNNNNTINYEGNLSTEEFEYSGSSTIEFSKFPTFEQIEEGNEYPQLSYISSQGQFSTDKFKIDGSTEVEFTPNPVDITTSDGETMSLRLPDIITYTGGYQDLTGDPGFTYDGFLEINPDYTNFDIDLSQEQLESENNYLEGTVTLDGSLTNTDFADVGLNVVIERDGYQHYSSDFRYNYNDGKYIEGTASNGDEEEFSLEALNEQNIKIYMQASYNDDQDKIGEIKNKNDKLYGEIYLKDGQIQVDFADGKIISLIPEQQ